mmetsp:Transcript_10812/g.10715  ORF Transcript_10812/g.10715 Transcript_10812/m.10715 type:complete len:188 (+) Transcript_10812:399-962(+)
MPMLHSHPVMHEDQSEGFFILEQKAREESLRRRSSGIGFGLTSQERSMLTNTVGRNPSNIQTAVSTPREREQAHQKPPSGKRIIKNFVIASPPLSYRKERVEARESAHMSFGLRNSFGSDLTNPNHSGSNHEQSNYGGQRSHAKAVPSAINSLNEIQLDLVEENEEERGEVPRSHSKYYKENIPSGD